MVAMPAPDQDVLARRAEIVAALRKILPGEAVIDSEAGMRPYETDALTAYRQLPLVVVLPSTTGQVSRFCATATTTGSRSCRAAPAPRCRAARCRSPTAFCWACASSTAFSRSTTTIAVVVAQPGVTNLAITSAVERARFLLRARSLVPDRLHHRRQCRGEFRRRALPEIRPDHQQCARRRDGADHRRGGAARRQASRRRGLRSASV